MQYIKSCVDELPFINVPYGTDELILMILHGLSNEYDNLSSIIKALETSISFNELHEKLITIEGQLKANAAKHTTLPAKANLATKPSHSP